MIPPLPESPPPPSSLLLYEISQCRPPSYDSSVLAKVSKGGGGYVTVVSVEEPQDFRAVLCSCYNYWLVVYPLFSRVATVQPLGPLDL